MGSLPLSPRLNQAAGKTREEASGISQQIWDFRVHHALPLPKVLIEKTRVQMSWEREDCTAAGSL